MKQVTKWFSSLLAFVMAFAVLFSGGGEGADTSYTDTKLKNKHTYNYTVDAFDADGKLLDSASASVYTTQK